MLKSLRFWLGLAISGVFLALLFRSTDLGELKDALREAEYWWLLPAFLVYLLGVMIRSVRWRILMSPLRQTSAFRLFPLMIIGYMANNLIPLRAGELVRAWATGERENVSKAGALGTIGVERLMDGCVLVVLLLVAGSFAGFDAALRVLAIAAALLFLLALGAFIYVTRTEERGKHVFTWIVRRAPKRFHERLEEVASSLIIGMRSIHSWRPLAAVVVTSFAAWIVEICTYLLIGQGFNLGVGFFDYMLLLAAGNLAVLIPATVGGVGPFEWASKEVLTKAGVGASVAAAYAVLAHALVLIPVTAMGLYFVWALKLNFGRILRANREIEEAPRPHILAPEPVKAEVLAEK